MSFEPEETVKECLERIQAIVDAALGHLEGTTETKSESEAMFHAGAEISPRAIANDIEGELLDLEDWIEEHLEDFCQRKNLAWNRAAHLKFAPRPGWISEGCRNQLAAIEASFGAMRDLCLEYAPHSEENSGFLAVARRVADAIHNPVEGYKGYIGGRKDQVADREFGYRFQAAGIGIGNACSELGSEIVIDMRRELKRLYRDVEVSTNHSPLH